MGSYRPYRPYAFVCSACGHLTDVHHVNALAQPDDPAKCEAKDCDCVMDSETVSIGISRDRYYEVRKGLDSPGLISQRLMNFPEAVRVH